MTPSDERPQIGDKVRSSTGSIGIVCEPPAKVSLSIPHDAVWAMWNDNAGGRPLWSRHITILERAKPDYNDGEWI